MRNRAARGFTMIELIVSVGLMVVLLGVLAFVFKTSTEAVSSATEAVTVWQKARNFEARLGRELASAVQYLVQSGDDVERAFLIDDLPEASSGTVSIEFVSQIVKDGVLDTYDVKYYYEPAPDLAAGEDYGAIMRLSRKEDYWGKASGGAYAYEEQTVVEPVKNLVLTAAGDWEPKVQEGAETVDNTRLPAYVKVGITFLDQWGGTNLEVPLEFYFPIYQGN